MKTVSIAAFGFLTFSAIAAPDFGRACREANALVERQVKAEKAARVQSSKTFIFGMKEGGSTYGLGQGALKVKEDPAIDAKVMAEAYKLLRAALPENLSSADEVRLAAAELRLEEIGGCQESRAKALAALTSRPTDADAVNAAMNSFKRANAHTEMLAFADRVIAANQSNEPMTALGLGWRWLAAHRLQDKTLKDETKRRVDALPVNDVNVRNTYMILLGYPGSTDPGDFDHLFANLDKTQQGGIRINLYRQMLQGAIQSLNYAAIRRWLPEAEKLKLTGWAYPACADAMQRLRCWKEADELAEKAYALDPKGAAAQLRLARTRLGCARRAEAQAPAEELAANEKASPVQRFTGRVLAAVAKAATPEDLTRAIAAMEADSGAQDGRQFAEWAFAATFQAFEPMMTSDQTKWLLAARKAVMGLLREEERIEYHVTYRASCPRTAGLAAAEGLFDPPAGAAYRVEHRFAPYQTYAWTQKKSVLNNLACEPKPQLEGVSGEGRSADIVTFYDETGVHVYTRFRDPAAARFKFGEVPPAGYEFTVWTGDGGWNQIFTRTDATKDLNEVTWDSLDYAHPSTFGSIITDSTTTDEAFLFHTFIPWTHAYDRIPTRGQQWLTVMCASMPAGTFVLGGGAVHELGRGMRLVFDFTPDTERRVRRALVRCAAGKFLRFKADWKNIDRWDDEILGDPAFAQAVVTPWSERVGRVAASLLSRSDAEVTDAESTAAEALLADWLDPQLKLDDARTKWLQDGLFVER